MMARFSGTMRPISAVVSAFCLAACSSAGLSQVRQAPLDRGAIRAFDAPQEQVIQATEVILSELGFEIEDSHAARSDLWMIIGNKGASGFSWGEAVRVTVQKDGDSSVVRVLTAKHADSLAAEDDWSPRIFEALDARLASGS